VVKLEQNFQQDRTPADLVADAIAAFTGSLKFVALHALVFGGWIAINRFDLQINLLTEREMTFVLQMLQRMSRKMGVQPLSEEIEELAEETPVEHVVDELQKNLPND
jgi:uncharacterized membrane protein